MPKLRKHRDRQRKSTRESRLNERLCRICQKRPALFIRRIRWTKQLVVRRDKDHDLCGQCHRSLSARFRQKGREARRTGAT